jgi:hypothetical protein
MIIRSKYQKLFDPRCKRATSKGTGAQAEHVTGTHLYAYLQEAQSSGWKGSMSSNLSTISAFVPLQANIHESCHLMMRRSDDDETMRAVAQESSLQHSNDNLSILEVCL